MSVHKQSVSFTEQAFAHVQALVDAGEYPNVSAAVSGELARARAEGRLQRVAHRGAGRPSHGHEPHQGGAQMGWEGRGG